MKNNKQNKRVVSHNAKEEKRRSLLNKKYETSDERRSAKRVVQLSKQNERREARVVKYGTDSVGVKVANLNHRFIATFVALVMALGCMSAGLSFMVNADDETRVTLAKTSSVFKAVTCNVQFCDVILSDFTVSVSAGDIDENVADVQDVIDEEAHTSATYKKAVVIKSDGTQTKVANVGAYGSNTYYSIEGNNEDTGIRLKTEDGEQLVLMYDVVYDVTYYIDGAEGKSGTKGSVSGQDNIKYGYPLDIIATPNNDLSTSPATIYAIDSGTYSINSGSNVSLSFDESNSATIPASSVTGPVTVNVNFVAPTKFTVYGSSVTQGHVCANCSISASESAGGGDISGSGTNASSDYRYYRDFDVTAGATAYIMLYSQTPKSGGIFSDGQPYFLNMIKINGEEVDVPTSYSKGASATTTLSNGSVVYIECLGIAGTDRDAYDSHASSSKKRSKYLITITSCQEDIYLTTYFRLGGEQKMYLKGLRGINYTAASHQTTTYRRWLFPYYNSYPNEGFNYFYTLDLSDEKITTTSERMHVYDAYYSQTLLDQMGTQSGFMQNFARFFNSNPISSSSFPCKNVYLYKVKAGYNPVTVELGTPQYNYGNLNTGSEAAVQLSRSSLESDTSTDEFPSVFGQAVGTATASSHSDYYQWNRKIGDDSSTAKTYGGYGKWFVVIGAFSDHSYSGHTTKFAFSDVSLLDLNVASTTNYNSMGKYSEIYGDEVQDSSYTYSSWYPAFYSGIRTNKYRYGFMLDEHSGENQSITINALPYQYAVEYDLDGGTITHGSDASNYSGTSGTFYEEDTSQNDSYARHNIEDSATITMPESEPTKADTTSNGITTSYSFIGWTVVDTSGSQHGTYMPGQVFTINDETAGYDSSSKQGDWTYGYAQEDKSVDDDYLKFHFIAKWKTTSSTDLRTYKVLGFKETPTATVNATLTSSNSFQSTSDGSAISPTVDSDNNVTNSIVISADSKTYTLYYYNDSSKATVGDNVISFNDHDPSTDSQSYVSDESLSSIEITSLGSSDAITYYYDVVTYDVTIKEATLGTNPDTSKTFDITASLKDESGNSIANSVVLTFDYVDSNGDEGTLTFTGGTPSAFTGSTSLITASDGQFVFQMKNDEYVTIKGIYENYQLTVSETAVDGYDTSYSVNDSTTSTYTDQAVTSATEVVVQNTLSNRTVTLQETVSGLYSNEENTFSPTLILIPPEGTTLDSDASKTIASGITLTKVSGDNYLSGTIDSIQGDGAYSQLTLSMPAGWTLKITQSNSGTYYEDPEISYTKSGGNATAYDETNGISVDSDMSITIHNPSKSSIAPETGFLDNANHMSLFMYVVAGIFILAACVAFLYSKKKQNKV